MTDGELLKDEISSAWNKFQTSQPHDRSVEQNWCHFTSIILTAIKNHVPTKTISSKWNLPWITPGLRRLMKKKQRGYNLAKRTQNPQHWKKFKELRKTWKWSLLLAHNDYVLGLLGWSDKKNSPFIGKKFWTYIKSKRKDNVGISSLNSGNTEITDNKAKAEILSNQFKAVFTDEDVDTIPDMDSNGVSDIGQLVSQTKGIYKVSLLRNINKKKASGPDGISCWVLKEAEEEIAPFLQFIFNQSLTTSQVQVTGNVPMWPQCLKKAVRKKPATTDQYLSLMCPVRSWSTLSSIILWVTWTRIMYLSTTSMDFARATHVKAS